MKIKITVKVNTFKMPPKKHSQKSLAEKWQGKSKRDHILAVPGMYIGPVIPTEYQEYIVNDTGDKFEIKDVKIPYGLYKIFDETIVNAVDHYMRCKTDPFIKESVSYIKVIIDEEEGMISVENDGPGIDIEIHPEFKDEEGNQVYIPEMIFGSVFTGSNYDDTENEENNDERLWGGKHGIGVKATNIYSTNFTIETIDGIRKKKYIQTFENNMGTKNKPKITSYKSKPYTKVSYFPDLNKFKLVKLSGDIVKVMKSRVYNIAGNIGKDVTVSLNGEAIRFKNFEDYGCMYIGQKKEYPRIYINPNERWEVIVAQSFDQKPEYVSTVNFIKTKTGKHIDHVSNAICNGMRDILKNRVRNKIELPISALRDNMMLIVKSFIPNPEFDSQTKDNLKTPMTRFNGDPETRFSITEDQLKKIISSTGIVEAAQRLTSFKDNEKKLRTDVVRKTSSIRGIEKYETAKYAGTRQSDKCTLILTEGDSAKAFAMAARSVIGSEYFGIFPLKGKLLNTHKTKMIDLDKNEEIANLRKIIGLQLNKKYESTESLRYGHILILTDQDDDGFHIKGLFINFVFRHWKELLRIDGFIRSFNTPIVQVKRGNEMMEFDYNQEYEEWMKQTPDHEKWNIKYNKGLAKLKPVDARRLFKNYDDKFVNFNWSINEEKMFDSSEAIELAFNKDLADDRKVWLKNYDRNSFLNKNDRDVTVAEFIHKCMIHFSIYDTERSIPSLFDGLKPSMRKILYTANKINFKTSKTIVEFTGDVFKHAAYHHGDSSVHGTVNGLAQDYVGSNNINIFYPEGQVGTRLAGGKDAGDARYVETYLDKITEKIFRDDDNCILDYRYDNGKQIEPYFYMPIIPMILVNGTVGIGTGFSSDIPAYSPLNIIDNLRRMMDNKPIEEMTPWYRGFTGNIVPTSYYNGRANKFDTIGKYEFMGNQTIYVSELPIGIWTTKYKEHLENLIVGGGDNKKKKKDGEKPKKEHERFILDYDTSGCTDFMVGISIQVTGDKYKKYKADNDLMIKELKLKTSCISMTNMTLFNEKSQVDKYTIEDIFDKFYTMRIKYYQKRRDYILKKLRYDLNMCDARIKFINDYMDNVIELNRKSDEEIYKQFTEQGYPKYGKWNQELQIDENPSWDYLLDMPMRSLTAKKIESLRKDMLVKQEKVDHIENITNIELWKSELKELEEAYEVFMDEYDARNDPENVDGDIVSKKKKKSRKSNNKKTDIISRRPPTRAYRKPTHIRMSLKKDRKHK